MCQYSSSCVVLQNAMRTQQRQQHHQQQQQPQQVGAGSQNQQVRQVHQQQATKMNGHSNVLQTSNSENVPRRQTCQGHGKMAKGRRATAHQLGQNLSKLAKSDPMANGDVGRVVTGFGRCRSGSGSAGSSPTKQFHAGPPQTYQHQQQPTGSGRIGSGSPRPVAGQNSSSSIRSRSYTPPSRDRLLHGSSTAAGGRAMSPSPSLTYAGARFSEPPSPKVLPRPPTHWFASADQAGQGLSSCTEMTNALKGMLKVQC